jgi:hypothetical protein
MASHMKVDLSLVGARSRPLSRPADTAEASGVDLKTIFDEYTVVLADGIALEIIPAWRVVGQSIAFRVAALIDGGSGVYPSQ